MTYRLDDGQLARIFPFHLVLDPDLRIVSHGPSLGKIDPSLREQPSFTDHFRIRTPRIDPDFETLHRVASEVSAGNASPAAGKPVLTLVSAEPGDRDYEPTTTSSSDTLYVLDHLASGLSLRMQMIAANDPTTLVFVGSPLLTEPGQLDRYGLSISDFAPFDCSLDYILALRTKDSLIDETTRLTSKLEQTNQDLQEQIEARAAADKAKDLFLMTMSHEIRTPMNAITGLTSLLLQLDSDTTRRRHLSTVETAARTLQSLIDGVLDFTKIESGAFENCEEDFDLLDLVEQAVRLFGPAAREKGLELGYEFGPSAPRAVHGDLALFNRVVSNLTHNAIKFTETGWIEIAVTARPIPDHAAMVRVEVTDTGIGLAAADQERIFDRFTQVRSSATSGAGGTGLGLAISRKICEARGGRIGVESTPGQGSVFWFEFPLQLRADAPQESAPSPQPAQQQHTPDAFETALPVLVVDDNAINRNMVVDMLEWLGVETEAVADGMTALERTADRNFSAILMDIQMPGLDGYETARRIRSRDGRDADIPIIGLSANAFQQDREAGLAAGMDDYVAKPITIESMIKVLRRWPQTGYRSTNNAPRDAGQEPSMIGRLSPEAADLVASSPLLEVGDDSTVSEYLEDFIAAAPETLAALRQSLDERTFDEIYRLAHNLKGSSLFLGIDTLTEMARRLELASEQCDPSEAASVLSQIQAKIAEIGEIVSTLRPPTSSPASDDRPAPR